jgi:hypothetical protein
MMVLDNFVHADMHQGNILFWDNPNFDPTHRPCAKNCPVGMTLLDCGVVATVSDQNWTNIYKGISINYEQMVQTLIQLNTNPRANTAAFKKNILQKVSELLSVTQEEAENDILPFLKERVAKFGRDDVLQLRNVKSVSEDGQDIQFHRIDIIQTHDNVKLFTTIFEQMRLHHLKCDSNICMVLSNYNTAVGNMNHQPFTFTNPDVALGAHDMQVLYLNVWHNWSGMHECTLFMQNKKQWSRNSQLEEQCAALNIDVETLNDRVAGFASDELLLAASLLPN